MTGTLFAILGSLGMFLFGMKVMSEALQKMSGKGLRTLMRTMTGNRASGVGTGFLVTALVQSSSASTVMIVSFVNAGLLTLTESVGMIMGANLGTTTTFWLISYFGFSFSVSSIALPIIGVGFPLLFFRRTRASEVGEFLIGFGLLFLGLLYLKESVPDIQDNPEALAFVQNFTGRGLLSVLFFFAFGTLLTIGVQSSSVAGAITITMAFKGWIEFPAAAAVILGENVGTTITANLAALTGNTSAKRAALAHLLFNLFGVLWAIVFFDPFRRFVDWVTPGDSAIAANIPIHMASFHTIFNLCNIFLLIGLVPQITRLVERLIRDRPPGRVDRLTFHSATMPETGELSVAEAERGIQVMGRLTNDLLTGFVELFERPGKNVPERAEALKAIEDECDRQAVEITNHLLRCSAGSVSQKTLNRVSSLLRVVAELEDICDCAYRLVRLAEYKHRKNRIVPPDAMVEVRDFATLLFRFMDFWSGHLLKPVTSESMKTAYELEDSIDDSRSLLRKQSMRRMQRSGDAIKAEMLYIDILNNMEKIGNHSVNILQALRHQ